MKIGKLLLKLLRSQTPNAGKSIRNLGGKLLGIGVAGITGNHTTNVVPEEYMLLIDSISGLVSALGVLLTVIGQFQTKEDPDTL